MRTISTAAVIAAACLATGLAGCGEKPAADGATTTAEAPAAPAPAAAPAGDGEGPIAGKWRMSISTMGMTLPPQEVCQEKAMTMAEMQGAPKDAGITCSEQTFKRDGDAHVGHSVCTTDMGGQKMTVTSDVRITGDFKTKYTMEATTKMDPPPMPNMAEQKSTIVAERVGDCDPPKPPN